MYAKEECPKCTAQTKNDSKPCFTAPTVQFTKYKTEEF